VKQFPDDLYDDGGILFCKYCCHSIDMNRLDTIKDHLKSKNHVKRKSDSMSNDNVSPSQSKSQPRQTTISSMIKSKDLREDFVLDFVTLCTVADIPLEKVDKMKPFLEKHCSQGGTIPKSDTLRGLYVPRAFDIHMDTLKSILQDKIVSIIADETTDCRDHSILNIMAMCENKTFLIDCVEMQECNHKTLSQAVVKAVTDIGIKFEHVQAFVTDSAAYCIKAYKDVISNVFPNCKHVRCFAHILNLAGDTFAHWPGLDDVAQLNIFIKSSFFKKPGRKHRYLAYIKDQLPAELVKLPPEPVQTRFN
jgi:hypothetical protein